MGNSAQEALPLNTVEGPAASVLFNLLDVKLSIQSYLMHIQVGNARQGKSRITLHSSFKVL